MDTIQTRYESQSEGAKYQRLAQALREAVIAGELVPGSKLPPVRDLAWALKITPGTAARAYSLLTDDGTLKAEVGRGTFVADPDVTKKRDRERDRRWSRHISPEDTNIVSLFAPKLPEMGQVAMIHDSFARLSERPPSDLLTYPGRASSAGAQTAALRWLAPAGLGPLSEQDVALTHGSQNGIITIFQAILTGSRPVVLVEELSYPGFRRAAELMRAELVAVPMDADGVIPEALDRIAASHNAQLFCTCPDIHNPTCLTTPEYRRREIAEVARRRGLHIIQDESYTLSEPAAPSYRALLPELGWYVTSISKLLTPSLRVGFAVAPKQHRLALRRAAEYGYFGLAQPLCYVLEDLLARPETQDVIDDVRLEMRRYIEAAVNVLGGHDINWHPDIPYIWLNLPQGWRAAAFARAAERQGVQLRTAEDFVPRDGFAPHAVRLAVNAQVSLNSFEEAVGRLRELLDNPPEAILT
ncbi:MAG: PLP-dependent aminotransferase family protein [Pelagimonas sp.]